MRLVASLIAESRVREFDPGQYHTFVEIDNGILSLFILEGLLGRYKRFMCTMFLQTAWL